MGRARARRQQSPSGEDRLTLTAPEAWLSPAELATLDVEARWRLAAERRRAALQVYAREHRLYLDEATRRFSGPRIRDRRQALAYAAEHEHRDHEELAALIRTRRRAALVSSP
jgi:hypothetical protein